MAMWSRPSWSTSLFPEKAASLAFLMLWGPPTPPMAPPTAVKAPIDANPREASTARPAAAPTTAPLAALNLAEVQKRVALAKSLDSWSTLKWHVNWTSEMEQYSLPSRWNAYGSKGGTGSHTT